MQTLMLVAAVLSGFVSALPADSKHEVEPLTDVGVKNTALERLVLEVLEQVRGIMVTGSDEFPVLDPLIINNARLDLGNIGLDIGHIGVTNFNLTKLSTFEIDSLSITSFLVRYTVEIEAHLPVLDFTSENYDLDLTMVGFNLYGNGEASGKITGPRVKATIVVSPRFSISQGLFIQINSANIKIGLDTFEPKLTGIFGNDPATDFINRFLENLIPELLEYFEDDITEVLNYVVMEYGNQILADLDIGSIIGRDLRQILTPPAEAETLPQRPLN